MFTMIIRDLITDLKERDPGEFIACEIVDKEDLISYAKNCGLSLTDETVIETTLEKIEDQMSSSTETIIPELIQDIINADAELRRLNGE